MAGIYIHVPFCVSKCNYCDFYSETKPKAKSTFVDSLKKELKLRSKYLTCRDISTIYFGGGTPSLLMAYELTEILNTISELFNLSPEIEITLEANPEDLSQYYLEEIAKTSVNRLSIGIQSFDDNELKFLNRRHNSQRAVQAITDAKKLGFNNISGDLIYSIPISNSEKWKYNLDYFFSLEIPHLSAYDLIYEKNTKIYKQLKSGEFKPKNDEKCEEYYSILVEKTHQMGYEHYELSNFALKGFKSRHNSSYWNSEPYLGIGPAAHSFNGASRQWNIANTDDWQKALTLGTLFFEVENLTIKDIYNELIITGIRTSRGVSLSQLEEKTSLKYAENLRKIAEQDNKLDINDNHVVLKKKYWFISDTIISNLLLIDEL